MNIDFVGIQVIDTMVNDRNLIIEDTAFQSPRLIFKGNVDRYNILRASELNFNFLVKSNAEAVFYHLFTGNETRYKVILSDITDELNPVVLWEGFLLPEQFDEPYIYADFFVEFVATDGLGRLKGKELLPTFYQDNKDVSEVLAECLRNTGLSYPMVIAPAIINTVLSLRLSDLQIQTVCYTDQQDDKVKKKDAYTILTELLKALGCSVVQWKQKWYIIGINRQKEAELVIENYDASGAYVNSETLYRDVVTKKFLATPPIIKMLPPFKKVILNWDKAAKENLLPLDVVNENVGSLVLISNYWTMQTDSGLQVLLDNPVTIDFHGQSYNSSSILLHSNSPYFASPNIKKRAVNPYISAGVATEADLDANYITMQNPICINRRRNETVTDTKFVLKGYAITDGLSTVDALKTKLENGDFNDTFYWAVTYKPFKTQTAAEEELLFTNRPQTGKENQLYNFKLTVVDREEEITVPRLQFELELDRLPIVDNGYYNVRLYPLVGADASLDGKITFNELTWTYPEQKTEVVTKTRAIDYTTVKEETVFHGDSEMALTNRQFVIDSSTPLVFGVSNPEDAIQVERLFFDVISVNTWFNVLETAYYGISFEVFQLLYQPTTHLYIRKAGATQLQRLTNFSISSNFTAPGGAYSGSVIYQVESQNYQIPDAIRIEQFDTLYIKTNQLENYTEADYAEFAFEKWRRYDVPNETERYIECLARLYHDAVKDPRFVINGTFLGFASPLDLLSFDYKGQRNYQSTRLELDFTKGTTQADWVEVTHDNVIDYAAE